MEAEVPSSAALLASARASRVAAERAEVEVFETSVAWAARHPDPVDPRVVDPYGPEDTWLSGCGPARGADQAIELAGPGAPTVSQLAFVE